MRTHWLESGTGTALLREEARQVAGALDSIFGDQCLQIGLWGDPSHFRQSARTRRYAVVAAEAGPGVDFVSAPEDLAVANDSIDAVLLPHALETTHDPHAVLREVDRILRPDGHVVVVGFNPWGSWGLRHYLSRHAFPAGGQRMISEHRLRDWLRLLDYHVHPARFYHFVAPLYRATPPAEPDAPAATDSLATTTGPGPRRWHPLAACYVVVARREVLTVTPIRPAFRRRAQLVGGLVNPTTRNAA